MAGSGETPEIQWLEPWYGVAGRGPEFGPRLEQQLRREVAPGHPLFGVPVEAIGKTDTCDDALFRLLDGSGRVAWVHLTYSRGPDRPPWPSTEIYATLEEWVEDCMRNEHEDFLLGQEAEDEERATGEAPGA